MLGFRNMGNTCYMNSVLSVLLNCPNFVRILEDAKDIKDTKDEIKPRQLSAGELLRSFKQLLSLKQKVKEESMGVIQPGGILRLMFKYLSHRKVSPIVPMRQNDALECLGVFLDAFEDGTSKTIETNWTTGGIRRDIVRKATNEVVDSKKEQQITWNIQIPESKTSLSLQDCMFSSFDNSCEEIRYQREEDSEEHDYLIKRTITSTPKLWFLSLARWNMMQNKIMSPVSIPVELKICKKTYTLRGMICHMGYTNQSGHYYSVIMTSKDKAYRVDDDRIYPCPIPFPEVVQRHVYGVMYEVQN